MPRPRPSSIALAVIVLAAAQAARAAPAAAPPLYPVDVRIELSRKAAGAMFHHGIGPSLLAPPNPSCSVTVGEQAGDAYGSAGRRMFRGGSPEAARLELAAVAADLDLDLDGWHAVVEHTLVLRSASGAELGRWVTKGRDRVEGLGENAIPRAFRGAAEKAAARFEASFAEPAGVARWLTDSGVALASAPRPGVPPDVPLVVSTPAPPPRVYAAYVDAGAGNIVATETKEGRVHEVLLPALALRVGVSMPWAFVQFARARTTGLVDKTGFEGGPLLRLSPNLDLKAGGGAHRVSVPDNKGATVASVFAAVHLVLPVKGGVWLRLGLEVRHDFGPSRLTRTEDGLGRYEAARGPSGWAFVGLDLGNPG